MSKTITDKTIALSGIFQAAYLVDQIATKGMYDSSAFESSITSILKVDADDVLDVYGSIEGVATGFSVLIKQLGINKKNNQPANHTLCSGHFTSGKTHKQKPDFA